MGVALHCRCTPDQWLKLRGFPYFNLVIICHFSIYAVILCFRPADRCQSLAAEKLLMVACEGSLLANIQRLEDNVVSIQKVTKFSAKFMDLYC